MSPVEALALQHAWVTGDSLRKHMLAVATCLRAYAPHYGGDPDLWETVGLLHDFDYERHPSLAEHPLVGVAELRRRGVDEVICRAVLSHADHADCPRVSDLEKCLYACDELAGFLVAVALLRPEQLAGMGVSSVKKKLKTKAFAANVSRDDIARGAAELGVDLDSHIACCIAALQTRAAELGLAG
ncbi:MAG: HDIG domain-containing protein [Fimbriimonadaceae bacterium]|nr:HDIG domain-containing protein [Fimbriimonadaceae bacterium]